MSEECASYLRAARALLHLNIKSVARALRFSDNTLTQLERWADEEGPREKDLVQFYVDHGLEFKWDGKRIAGVVLTKDVNPLVLTLRKYAAPGEAIRRFCKELRYVGEVVYNLKLLDKTKASGAYDTIEVHFPVPTRRMAREILCRWFDTEGAIEIIDSDGEITVMNKANVEKFL